MAIRAVCEDSVFNHQSLMSRVHFHVGTLPWFGNYLPSLTKEVDHRQCVGSGFNLDFITLQLHSLHRAESEALAVHANLF